MESKSVDVLCFDGGLSSSFSLLLTLAFFYSGKNCSYTFNVLAYHNNIFVEINKNVHTIFLH